MSNTRHPLSKRFHEILLGMGEIHDNKSADYGTGADPLANFRGALEWDVPQWVGCMLRLEDKIARLKTYAKTGILQNEGVLDAFRDLQTYAVLAQVLFEEATE